ncbi:sialate O-acetylesterase [Pseudomonas kurunegalensis]|uniref:sialate O-acetylesterase n=1 Tax=Pseudomonas kurunegalensis TaxID=485880 RepID=UPI00257074DC|nr:sialate O-acetylesterase [Pseudomonas kurunegalensis]WJD63099.1 sialate O-acetylesterase [Pseudomonas kurunegalensis]
MELKNYFAQDDQGNILGGATCYLYKRGTESLVNGLQRANGVALDNPFNADATGLIQLAAANGLYDLRVVTETRDYRVRVQFNDVGDTLLAANAAANDAQRARDAAEESAGLFPSTVIGLQKTVSGQYFSVPSPDSLEYTVLFYNNSGVAEQIDSRPNAEANRLSIRQSTLALERTDPRMLSAIYGWGTFDKRGAPILAAKRNGVAVAVLDELPGLFFLSSVWRHVVVDRKGVILNGYRWDGTTLSFGDSTDENIVPYQLQDSGLSDIWMIMNGASYQMTTSGHNWDPKVSNGYISYMSRAGANVEKVQAPLSEYGKFAAYIRRLVHIPSHGQSLSLGVHSQILTTQPPVANRVFTINVGLRQSDSLQAQPLAAASVLPLKPMVSVLQEAPHAQFCASLARHRNIPADAGIIGSCHGVGATSIQNLDKGSVSYNNLITTVAQCKADATARGYAFSVPFVDWIQGEANSTGSKGAYLTALLQLQQDFTTDIGAISGDSNVPMLLCQMSSWTTKNIASSFVPHEQLQAALENRTKFLCAGPKYWVEYHTDGVHLTGKGSLQVAEMRRAAAEAILDGRGWLPTHCTSATRAGAVVTLKFHTPVGPLVSDTVNVTDPGNLGIRWSDDADSASVTAVQVNDDNTVTVTLSAVPTGANPKVGIADVGIPGALGGPTTGARSCLRDSNTARNTFGEAFYNWACHQIITVE